MEHKFSEHSGGTNLHLIVGRKAGDKSGAEIQRWAKKRRALQRWAARSVFQTSSPRLSDHHLILSPGKIITNKSSH